MSAGPTVNGQDLPPAGGYPSIRYKRNIPIKGPSGALIFGSVALICGYGFYRLGNGNLEKRELKREEIWCRFHLVPLLQAEADRDSVRRSLAMLDREKEIMKDVPDWVAGESVYNKVQKNKGYVKSTIFPI